MVMGSRSGCGVADPCALQMLSCSHFYFSAKCVEAQEQTKAGGLDAKKTGWRMKALGKVGFSLGHFIGIQ